LNSFKALFKAFLKIIAHFLQILNKFFESFQNFVISIRKLDFYEEADEITNKVLKKSSREHLLSN